MKAKIPAEIIARREKGDYISEMVKLGITQKKEEIEREAIAKATKLSILVISNLLVEKHGWGTRDGSTRLPELMEDVANVIIRDGERYGFDCVMAAQEARARANGFEVSV